MLAATAILLLLAMMLSTGLQMTLDCYQKITAQSEVELLLSTAMDALTDDLRYAWNVKGGGNATNATVNFTYSSDSYGDNTQLDLDGNYQIIANDVMQVLSTGAYGAEGADGKRAYQVTEMKITPKGDKETLAESKEVTFEIHLKVEATADPSINAEATVNVRCLNPPKEKTTQAGGS